MTPPRPAGPRPPRRNRPINMRRTGLVVAVGVGLIGVGLTLIMFAKRNSGGAGSGPTVGVIDPVTPGTTPPTTIGDIGVGGVGKATVQYVDKADPTRLAGTIQWSAVEPLAGNRANVTEPLASIFLKDRRVVVISSPKGRLYTPVKTGQPESGYFEGGVLLAMFEPGPGGVVDVKNDSPTLLFHTASLNFDLALGEVSSVEAFVVSSANVEVRGKGFRVLLNQVAERIERLDITGLDLVRIAPGVKRAGRASATSGPAGVDTADAARSPGAGPAVARGDGAGGGGGRGAPLGPDGRIIVPSGAGVRVQTYQIKLQDAVTLARREQSLQADTMDIWLRLVNGELPDGAIPEGGGSGAIDGGGPHATAEASPSPKPRKPAPRPILLSGMPAPSLEAPPVLAPVTDDDIVLRSTGPLQMVPLAGTPAELDRDHVFARFSAPRSGEVTLRDTRIGFAGRAPTLAVGVTRQDVLLSGSAPTDVSLALKDKGELIGGNVAVNLGAGVAQVRGPGELKAGRTSAKAPARGVTWSEQADFAFAMVDGSAEPSRLEMAKFDGSVLTRQGEDRLSASSLVANFDAPRVPGGEPTLAKVRATSAEAISKKGQTLRAALLEVTFGAPARGNDPEPTGLDAGGDVTAFTRTYQLACDNLHADLGRDENGDIAPSKVFADGSVQFGDARMGRGGLCVNTERLIALPGEQRVDLIGAQTSITSAGLTILGGQMNVDGVKRELFVHGPGLFTLRRKAQRGSAQPGEVAARPVGGGLEPTPALVSSWTKSMRVNDLGGIAELFGDTRTIAGARPSEFDTVSAARTVVTFTPGSPEDGASITSIGDLTTSPASPASSAPSPLAASPGAERDLPDRRVLTLEAVGQSMQEGAGPRATVESRRYASAANAEAAAPGGERPVSRLLYLEGDRILAAMDAGTMEVPGAGRLLIDQREPRDRASPASSSAAPEAGSAATARLIDTSKGARGTSLFDWTGGLTLDRQVNAITIRDNVNLIHKRAGDDRLLTLQAQTLTALLRDVGGVDAPAAPPLGRPADLRQVSAVGGVFVRTDDDKQLQAGQLTYDTDTELLEASAGSDERVTFLDPAKPAPIAAQALRWWLRDGRIEVSQPSATIVPR